MEVLKNELIACPNDRDAYYKGTVRYRKYDNQYVATIPGVGKFIVYKDIHSLPEVYTDFAWQIKEEA